MAYMAWLVLPGYMRLSTIFLVSFWESMSLIKESPMIKTDPLIKESPMIKTDPGWARELASLLG